MTEQSAPAATAFDHNSTLVLALELSGKGWQVGAVLPGVARRPRRSVAPRDMAGLLTQIERWKAEAQRAGRTVLRTVLAYEAGRDGFWIARCLLAHGIEVQIMHPASIPVERRGRRAKTDRIDLDMLLRTLLAWLRGEPRVCSMVRIPSETEEDMRRPEGEPNGWWAKRSRWRTDREPAVPATRKSTRFCQERSDAAISIAVRNGMGIALMSLVKQQHKRSPFQLCERWIFQQR